MDTVSVPGINNNSSNNSGNSYIMPQLSDVTRQPTCHVPGHSGLFLTLINAKFYYKGIDGIDNYTVIIRVITLSKVIQGHRCWYQSKTLSATSY